MGRPSGFAPGVLSGTVRASQLLQLLLKLLKLAVTMIMNACPRLALLVLVTASLLVTLFATNETLVVIVPTVPLCFRPSGLSTLTLVVFVSSTALQLYLRGSH